jgi:hypothetical protein
MAINGIGSGFNPYTTGVTPQRGVGTTNTQRPAATENTRASATQSIADAIKTDATARAAQVNSAQAPEGVDQELWSVLSKEERSFFVKAGAMGPLTYGRFPQQAPQNVSAPLMRGGRLDIKA